MIYRLVIGVDRVGAAIAGGRAAAGTCSNQLLGVDGAHLLQAEGDDHGVTVHECNLSSTYLAGSCFPVGYYTHSLDMIILFFKHHILYSYFTEVDW